MESVNLVEKEDQALSFEEKKGFILDYLEQVPDEVEKVLLLPPDYTRKHSGAGVLAGIFYKHLTEEMNKEVEVMPALGTHEPMTEKKLIDMFGKDIPLNKFMVHDWRHDTVSLGKIPADFVRDLTDGKVDQEITVRINERLVSGEYDLIISIGQVLPHEVVGMANYNKNIFVGCGGPEIINVSHFVGAVSGMEQVMGRDHTPVRKLYDYAQEHLLKDIPLVFLLTVSSTEIDEETGLTRMKGMFLGDRREILEQAVELSQDVNIIKVDKPLNRVIVNLDEEEFKTTWLGCKAIYRTRMAIADGGELLIIAPGLERFGEDMDIDKLIRKYGYVGTKKVLELVAVNEDLQENLSAAAHLIHGSSEGRFDVTYACSRISKEEIEGVNFNYISLEEAREKYNLEALKDGYNSLDGEEIYYIDNPATGLWATADRF